MSKTIRFKLHEKEVPYIMQIANALRLSASELARKSLFQVVNALYEMEDQARSSTQQQTAQAGEVVDGGVTEADNGEGLQGTSDIGIDPLALAADDVDSNTRRTE